MKRLGVFAVIAVLALGVAISAQGARGAGSNAQTLTNLEHQWTKASTADDADALAPLPASAPMK